MNSIRHSLLLLMVMAEISVKSMEQDKTIRIGDKEYSTHDKIKLTNFQGSTEPLMVPIAYIQHSESLKNLLADTQEHNIELPKIFFKKDIDFIFNTIIEQISNFPALNKKLTKQNIQELCSKKVRFKSFYDLLRLIKLINYLDITINKIPLLDIFCSLLKNKKINSDEIEKCIDLNIQSVILSKIAWAETSFAIHSKPSYKSDTLTTSTCVSLALAVNEDCSKIAVVGLTDDNGKDRITFFEKNDNHINSYAYKKEQENQLLEGNPQSDYTHPYTFINVSFATKNHPLYIASPGFDKYKYNLGNIPDITYMHSTKNIGTHTSERLTYNNKKKLMVSSGIIILPTAVFNNAVLLDLSNPNNINANPYNINANPLEIDIAPAPKHASLFWGIGGYRYHQKLHYFNINPCFDKNGEKVALPCYKYFNSYYGISIYTIATKKIINISCAPHRIRCLALSNKGTFIAAQTEHQAIHLWNTETGALLKNINCLTPLIQILFTPDDNWLLLVPQAGSIKLVNIFTGKTIDTELTPFVKQSTIPCTSCVSLQEKDNELLLYGIFQNEATNRNCTLELFKITPNPSSNDFFLGLYMQQNNIREFNENVPDYPLLKPIYEKASQELKQQSKQPIATWSTWLRNKLSKYWYIPAGIAAGTYLYQKYKNNKK